VHVVAELDASAATELPYEPQHTGDSDLAGLASLSGSAHAPLESVH
jgi:hypothetical protein